MINKCRSCYSKNLLPILSLGDQYLSKFEASNKKPPKYPLNLILCEDCTLLQLDQSVPPYLLYAEDYGYRSGINTTMRNHLKGIVDQIREMVYLNDGDTVIDIGSNDGTLLKNYPSTLNRVGYDMLDKFQSYYDEDNLQLNSHAFNGHDKQAKVITAISCFYDLEDPNQFVEDVLTSLAPEGIFIIQQNYLAGMIRQVAFDNICHEHIEYYSLKSLENLLTRHGLEVFLVTENDLNGGSFRTFIRRANGGKIDASVGQMREAESTLGLADVTTYRSFSHKTQLVKEKLRRFVHKITTEGKSIYVYGASTRGNTILQYCGFDNRYIKKASERNEEKWGKMICSSGIPIVSEEQARLEKPDYMLCLPWFFADEFIKREKEYIDLGGSLIFPLPDPCVVSVKGIKYL